MNLTDAILAIDQLVAPARDQFRYGRPARVILAPGDFTRYAMTFTPPMEWSGGAVVASPGNHDDDAGVLSLDLNGRCCRINPDGHPEPNYVAEKLAIDNRYTLLAVGLVWRLMVDPIRDEAIDVDDIARDFASVAECAEHWTRREILGMEVVR